MFKMRKVVIVGAGHVGSHVALNLVQSGEADDIVLIDILREKAAGQALDLDDAISASLCHKDATVRAGSYEELNDADILVIAFGREIYKGETRLDMFDDTIRMANEVLTHLKKWTLKASCSVFQILRTLFVNISGGKCTGNRDVVFVQVPAWKPVGFCGFYPN